MDGDGNVVGVEAGEEDSVDGSLVVSQSLGVGGSEGTGEGDAGLAGDDLVVTGDNGQRREGSEGQGSRAGGEAGDELGGQGEDLVEVEGCVVRLGERRLVQRLADVGRVASLDGQDAAGDGHVCLVDDDGGGAQVGRDTHTLEDRGESNEGRGVGAGEGVGSLLHSGGTECARQEGDVLLLIVGNLHQVVIETLWLIQVSFMALPLVIREGAYVVEASILEIFLRVVCETLLVELALKVLESKSVVQDVDVTAGQSIKVGPLDDGNRRAGGDGRQGQDDG